MDFYGREEELNRIRKAVNADEMMVSLVYGRRRVGKSELVKQALNEVKAKSIYYECKQTGETDNAESLWTITAFSDELSSFKPSNIEEVLEYIFKLAKSEKLILVLDEYPYLRESVKGLDSIMQSLIDKYRDSSKIKLFVLGSYVDTMRSLFDVSNPLFGRVDLSIYLKPMDYYDSAKFYPNYSDEDKVRIYSVFGGIPYYNRLIDDKKSVRENITELIASPGARLENEVTFYIKSELSKIINANEVFGALAKGFSKYSDILSQSHISSSPTLADILDKLLRMEIVAKTAPINDENNRKKAGYYISDNLSLFYYRYIFRYSSQMGVMEPELFFDKYIAEDFEGYYVPRQFENISRQYLIRENKKGRIKPVFEKIGKYYYDNPKEHKNGEFDIVTEDENGYIFYEVKFTKAPLSSKDVKEEIAQVRSCGLNCYKYVFISKAGFEGKAGTMTKFIELKRLYK